MWLFKPFYLKTQKQNDKKTRQKKTKTEISQSYQFHFGFLVLSHSLKDSKNETHTAKPRVPGPSGLLCKARLWPGVAGSWPHFSMAASVPDVHHVSWAAWVGALRRRHTLCNPLDRMQSFTNSYISPRCRLLATLQDTYLGFVTLSPASPAPMRVVGRGIWSRMQAGEELTSNHCLTCAVRCFTVLFTFASSFGLTQPCEGKWVVLAL